MIVSGDTLLEIKSSIRKGLDVLRKPVPMTLEQWASEHFYLSSESSYIEGKWEAYPFQKAIMACISNDDIREVVFKKSARVGATKIVLASIGYFAEHKKRNQAVWQPTDDDADDFVKTEIDPMLRDVKVMQNIFPYMNSKHKNNTMRLKAFTGSSLHIRGGKAAKNYRRFSVDIGYIDELAGFDHNIEMEGDPVSLASKRVEGSPFPKMIYTSTPKNKGNCMISAQYDNCEAKFSFVICCPHCGGKQSLKWGGKDMNFGFKWDKGKPETVEYLCEHCSCLFRQDDFLRVWDDGRWETEDGSYLDNYGRLFDADGNRLATPISVGFHIWTAYSPMTTWERIVMDFEKAKHDPLKLQGFVNLTLGEVWEQQAGDKIDDSELMETREHYDAEVPDDVLVLTIGADVQDDRVEYGVVGWGVGEESWRIDYNIHYGNLSDDDFWRELYRLVKQTYRKADGTVIEPRLMVIDSGHYTDEVYRFCKRAGRTWAIPTKGSSVMGKPIVTFPRSYNKHGVYLSIVGTDTAKDLIYHRIKSPIDGGGRYHFPVADWCEEAYFRQLTAERRRKKYSKRGGVSFEWYCPKGKRNEVWDIEVLNLVAIRILQQSFNMNLDALQSVNVPSANVDGHSGVTFGQLSDGINL